MNTMLDTLHQAIDSLVETLRDEATQRRSKPLNQWMADEPVAMWKAAGRFAQQHGLRPPSMDDVHSAERLARGHSDYERKWALGIARAMQEPSA